MPSPPQLHLDSQLCFALHATTRAMVHSYTPLLDELGITYPQYLVLLLLWEEDGRTVKKLGERLFLDSGTLSPLVKRLEGHGLVRRERGGEDERTVAVWLTPRGRRLQKKAEGIPSCLLEQTGLLPSDVKRLRGELARLFLRITDQPLSPKEAATVPRQGRSVDGDPP